MNQNVILNFTNVYREESFYKDSGFEWIDCSDIHGTDCMCDSEAALQIQKRIENFSAHGLHFIDSGNYHYISKLWTDKINTPFELVVFDHHPDMQPSLFEDILTCGCWVKMALDSNPFLHRVALVGTDDRLLEKMDLKCKDRVVTYSENSLQHAESWKKFATAHFQFPVYISVDKDVLNPKEEITNWDQGNMNLSELESLLKIILKHSNVIGVDVCGACPLTLDGLTGNRAIEKDEHVNLELVRFLNEAKKMQA